MMPTPMPLLKRISNSRLLPLVSGMLFAQGRRTVASWLRAADLGNDYKAFYRFVGCVGRRVDFIASQLLRLLVSQLPLPERLLFALDDTPTKRAGPLVEGGKRDSPSLLVRPCQPIPRSHSAQPARTSCTAS